jgi:hypothetical protein
MRTQQVVSGQNGHVPGEQVLHSPHELAHVPRDAAERRSEPHRVAVPGHFTQTLHEQLVKPSIDATEDDSVLAVSRSGRLKLSNGQLWDGRRRSAVRPPAPPAR